MQLPSNEKTAEDRYMDCSISLGAERIRLRLWNGCRGAWAGSRGWARFVEDAVESLSGFFFPLKARHGRLS